MERLTEDHRSCDEVETRAALIASEKRARALFEGIEDSVFVHDLDGKILDANPAASRRLGYTREEFLKLNTRDIDAPEFAQGFEDRLHSQLSCGHLHCEGRHRTKDGRVFPVDINTSTIQLEDRRVVVAVIRDITERKALEQARIAFAEAREAHARDMEEQSAALAQSEERYRKLTEGLLDAVVVADPDSTVTLYNPAAERAFGFEPAEVLGRPLAVLLPVADRGDSAPDLEGALRTNAPEVVGRTFELLGRRKNGEVFPLEISLSSVETAEGLQFVGSIRDQTERQRMRDLVTQSDRLASIGLLSAGVAHEINNPLAFIANNLAVLERDLSGVLEIVAAYEEADGALETAAPEALRKVREAREELDWDYVRTNLGRMLGRTREGVSRVASIVQTLRGLARTAPPKLEPASLGSILAGALELIQGRARRLGIALTVPSGPEAEEKILCVPTQISQVLLNLIVNAVQAIEAKGPVEGDRIDLTIRRSGGFRAVEIRDTGGGIDPEAVPRLFDPFFTTKPVGEGTGLGLSISHGIIQGHGGRIEVENRPGQGATFRVLLPDRRPSGASGA